MELSARSATPGRDVADSPSTAEDSARRLLRDGEITVLGRITWSSNATYLTQVTGDGGELLAIYKPRRGERPLWDFPHGTLTAREVAAFETSQALGWQIVPDTVERDGPLGSGMVQRFVDHDPDEHYFTLLADHAERLTRFAAFDVVVNNADRKGGHVLLGLDGHLWGIDHGLSFHRDPKLRTVIWELASAPLGDEIEGDLRRLLGEIDGNTGDRLASLLSVAEVEATRMRVAQLLAARALPESEPGHHSYPWPLV